MTHPTLVAFCCIALLSTTSCKRVEVDKTGEQSKAKTPVSAAALREPAASEQLAAANAKRARVQELVSLMSTAQTQREVLAQQKLKIETRLASYQADSTATLDKLKAEMQMLQKQEAKSAAKGAGSGSIQKTAAFNERARNQLEHALAMDQEYQAQLKQANDELRDIDESMAAMRAEAALLQKEDRVANQAN